MKNDTSFSFYAAFSAILLLASAPAFAAASPEPLGKFGFWSAYKITENDQPVCYMSISARAPDAQKNKRGEVVLMIAHRPAENTTDVISYTAGLKFKPASEVDVIVGDKQFSLFTQGDTAWSRDAATDHAISQAIRKNATMTLAGLSTRGTKIGDTINLKGATAAYYAIGKACGLAVEEPKKEPKKTAKKPTTTTKTTKNSKTKAPTTTTKTKSTTKR